MLEKSLALPPRVPSAMELVLTASGSQGDLTASMTSLWRQGPLPAVLVGGEAGHWGVSSIIAGPPATVTASLALAVGELVERCFAAAARLWLSGGDGLAVELRAPGLLPVHAPGLGASKLSVAPAAEAVVQGWLEWMRTAGMTHDPAVAAILHVAHNGVSDQIPQPLANL